MGLLGPGANGILNLLDEVSAGLSVCNTFGPADVLRNETSLHAAIVDITKAFKDALGQEHFTLLLAKTFHMSTVLQHTAYQLLEWSSACQDLIAFGEAVPSTTGQAALDSLKAWKAEQGSRKRNRQLFETYMTKALLNRKPESNQAGAAAAPVVNFADVF